MSLDSNVNVLLSPYHNPDLQARGGIPHNEGKMLYDAMSTSLLVFPDGKLGSAITGGDYDGRWQNGERDGKGRFLFKGTNFKVGGPGLSGLCSNDTCATAV